MKLMESYGDPKRVRDFLVEDRLQGNLALPGDHEESASYHMQRITEVQMRTEKNGGERMKTEENGRERRTTEENGGERRRAEDNRGQRRKRRRTDENRGERRRTEESRGEQRRTEEYGGERKRAKDEIYCIFDHVDEAGYALTGAAPRVAWACAAGAPASR